MPTYQYRCTECATELEAVQKFTDPPLTVCPQCAGQLRKVYSAVGVVFKGSGFYATDSRSQGKVNAAKPAEAKSDSSHKGEATPAKTASAKPEKPASTATPDAA